MEPIPSGDVLDVFGLENEQEIDFETAYKMISNFDYDVASFHDDSIFPKVGYTESESLENIALSYTVENSHLRDQGNGEREVDVNWKGNGDKETMRGHTGVMKGHTGDEQTLAKADLLSRYESSAIEHFLDSLIFQDNDIGGSNIPEQQNKTISMAELKVTNKAAKASKSFSADPSSLDVYVPPAVTIPQISIKDEDIPADVIQDPVRLRKWKHVESERLRRNSTKRIFDDLIAMTRYPRIGETKISKPQTDKRVPKYTLLGFILEDFKMLLRANEELEELLRKGDIKGDRSVESGISAL
ncbi:hypothetical protein HG536_0C01740 [Torulaspora globosa]|uniref:INO2 bHLH domain-containing protein n=1 Tax=Torulaspora globosa TaxID=48254 RepID=A0A7G3ZES0_9SACH|nr:uncharacterized protein HG536_0C01740 [Torulaspora globosa]QLL32006.1 hypothetical protein HG536_0C01740 [Torulaspora globosa]